MPQQTINVGTSANDGTGDTLRAGGQKINANFTELYAADVTHSADIATLDGRVDTAEVDINAAEADIATLETTVAGIVVDLGTLPTDVDTLQEQLAVRGHNVVDYGAIGDETANDTGAFLAAIAAAKAAGGMGVVDVPGGRTYIIQETLTFTNGTRLRGVGADNDSGSASPPRLRWEGPTTDPMIVFDGEAAANLNNCSIENINLWGGANAPESHVVFTASGAGTGKTDTGCYLRNVSFFNCTSHSVIFEDGSTNFFFDNCRWDVCGTSAAYGVYWPGDGGNLHLHFTGATTFTCEDGAGGFLYLNAEGKSGSVYCVVDIDYLHLEMNSLAETYASGTNAYDKHGMIRLGIDQDVGPTSHHISCDSMSVQPNGSGWNSFCVFQITTSGGESSTIASQFVNIVVDSATGLGTGATGTDLTDVVRPIGGNIPSSTKPSETFAYASNWGRFQYGVGQGSVTNRVQNYTYAPNNTVTHMQGTTITGATVTNPTLTIPSVAFASLPTQENGLLQVCSDVPNGRSAGGTVVAGGGANIRMVQSNGTNWINLGAAT